jgi:anti-anti-sigma factor
MPIVSVVTVKGDLSVREMQKICTAIWEVADDKRPNRFVLDWGEVESLDPWAIGVLLSRTHALKHLSGELKFARMPSYVRATFSRYKLDDLFESYASIEDAIQSFDEEWLGDGTQH